MFLCIFEANHKKDGIAIRSTVAFHLMNTAYSRAQLVKKNENKLINA